jgi:glycosyltransferase involved in cell wall biosynthesis
MKVFNPLISVVIPSRATNLVLLKNVFSCLEKQTFSEFEVIVVCDRDFKDDERKNFLGEFNRNKLNISFFSHVNSNFIPHSHG